MSDEDLKEKNLKMSKMLEMSKRAIDDLKQKNENKDSIIEKLSVKAKEQLVKAETRIKELEKVVESHSASAPPQSLHDINEGKVPRAIRQRLKDGDVMWCLVDFNIPGQSSTANMGWLTEEKVLDVESEHGVELFLPEPLISSEEKRDMEGKVALALESEDKMKEEFRRYRVRSEIMIRQRDEDLARLVDSSLGEKAQKISGDDNASLLKRANMKVEELQETVSRQELRLKALESQLETSIHERVDLEDHISTLTRELESTNAAAEEMQMMMEQKIRTLAADNQQKDLNEAAHSSREREELMRLEREYAEFKLKSMLLIKERDDKIESLGGDAGRPPSISITDISSRSIADPPLPDYSYLKNVVLQYMCAEQADVKQRMEIALATGNAA